MRLPFVEEQPLFYNTYSLTMQKVFSIPQMREADRYTIENEPIASVDLMERAARACYTWMVSNISGLDICTVAVVCGMGNNGGDGLALARMLASDGMRVEVYVIALSDKGSPDFEINKQRLSAMGINICHVSLAEDFLLNSSVDIIVDAVFGSGLTRPLAGEVAKIIEKINAFDAEKIASRSTFMVPKAAPAGIVHVIVNGVLSVRDGAITGDVGGKALLK